MGGETYKPQDAWERARLDGVDIDQLEYLLSLTPSERITRHEQALAMVRKLRKAGSDLYGHDPRTDQPPSE